MPSRLQGKKNVNPIIFIDGMAMETSEIEKILDNNFVYVIMSPNKFVTKFLGFIEEKSKYFNIRVIFCEEEDAELEINRIIRLEDSILFGFYSDGCINDLLNLRDKAMSMIKLKTRFAIVSDVHMNFLTFNKMYLDKDFSPQAIYQLYEEGLLVRI